MSRVMHQGCGLGFASKAGWKLRQSAKLGADEQHEAVTSAGISRACSERKSTEASDDNLASEDKNGFLEVATTDTRCVAG